MVYIRALTFPYTGIKELFINYALFFIPFVNVITGLFFFGFIVQSIRGVLGKSYEMPFFKRAGHLFVDGLNVLVITFIYCIPLIIASFFTNTQIGFIVTIVLGLFTIFILPSVIISYAKNERFWEAFLIASILKSSFSLSMLKAWLIALLFGIGYGAAAFILSILTAITYIGPYIVFTFAIVALLLSVFPLFASAYTES